MQRTLLPELAGEVHLSVCTNTHREYSIRVYRPAKANLTIRFGYQIWSGRTSREQSKQALSYFGYDIDRIRDRERLITVPASPTAFISDAEERRLNYWGPICGASLPHLPYRPAAIVVHRFILIEPD
jgi:hypothetical protein